MCVILYYNTGISYVCLFVVLVFVLVFESVSMGGMATFVASLVWDVFTSCIPYFAMV